MHRLILFLLALLFGLTTLVQARPTPESKPSATPWPEVTPPPAGILDPNHPEKFDPAAATTAWLDTVPADKREKSDAYFEGGYWLILWNFLVAVAILLFLLQSRLSALLRDFAEWLPKFVAMVIRALAKFLGILKWLQWLASIRLLQALLSAFSKALQVVAYAIPFVLIITLLTFPLNVYQGFFREHQYGLATQTFGPWFSEQITALLISMIILSIALVVLYAVFRRAPRTWWIWGTIVATCLQILISFIAPLYIEPVFNTYKPLDDPKLRDPILAMASANEIPVHQVFVVDQSRQTTRISANVAGFFGTTRIALNDNLIKQCSLPEIRAVMAHEMGHYVLNHNMNLVLAQGLLYLVVFGLTARFFDLANKRWGNKWGIRGIGDPAGLPLLSLILSALFFVLTPVSNTVGRVTETEADAFGINTAREADGMAKIALKLGQYRKLNPTPMEEAIFFDHPSGRARIRMAMDWKAGQLPCGDTR